jgi:hypothetical protein
VKVQQDAGLPKLGPMQCMADMPRGFQPDSVAVNYVIAEAFVNMYRWVDGGVSPPRTPFIATGPDGKARLDANGNAIGGLRLPALAVPTATYGIGTGECFLLGYQVPFAVAKLRALYGTHRNYVRDVERAARKDAEDRLISVKAERAIVARAQALPVF